MEPLQNLAPDKAEHEFKHVRAYILQSQICMPDFLKGFSEVVGIYTNRLVDKVRTANFEVYLGNGRVYGAREFNDISFMAYLGGLITAARQFPSEIPSIECGRDEYQQLYNALIADGIDMSYVPKGWWM